MFDKYNNVATLVRDNFVVGLLIYLCVLQTANLVISLFRDMRIAKAMSTAMEMSGLVKQAFGILIPPDISKQDSFKN